MNLGKWLFATLAAAVLLTVGCMPLQENAGTQGVKPQTEQDGGSAQTLPDGEGSAPTLSLEAVYVGHVPPALHLKCGSIEMETVQGTFTWSYDKGDGTWVTLCADSAHPLQVRELLTPFQVTEGEARLVFEAVPDTLSVRCWNETCWGDPSAPAESAVTEDLTLKLHPGKYIYEITATWINDGGSYGTATYCVCMDLSSLLPLGKG